jgi:hypothetical protein
MNLPQILALTGAITAVAAALGAVGWMLRVVLRMGGRIGDIHGDWFGEPAREGVPARKGVMARLSFIEAELTYNGGRSTKDMLRTLAAKLDEVARLQAAYHPVSPVQINMHPGQAIEGPHP